MNFSADKPLRLVIFDVDGTLVDSQAVIIAAMRHGFEAVGREPPPNDVILSVVGLSLVEAVSGLIEDAPRDEAVRIAEHYKGAFSELRAAGDLSVTSPPYPGAREAVERLAAVPEVLLGVATGKSDRGLRHTLGALDLASHFVTRQTADGHPSKPHPSMVLKALAETGGDARHAVMIGDTEFDMQMGRSAGVATIGVSWGYHPVDRLHAAGAHCIIEDFADLDAALADIWTLS